MVDFKGELPRRWREWYVWLPPMESPFQATRYVVEHVNDLSWIPRGGKVQDAKPDGEAALCQVRTDGSSMVEVRLIRRPPRGEKPPR